MQVHLNACRPAVGAFARHEVRRADWDKQPNRQSIQVLLIGGVLPSLNRAFPYRIVPLRRQQAQYVTLAVGAALRMRPGGGLPTRGGRLQSRGSLLERWIALQGRLDAAQEPFQHGDMQPGCLRIVATGGDFQSPVSAFQHEPAAPVQGCAPVPIRIARDVRLQRIEDRRPQHAGERSSGRPFGFGGSPRASATRQCRFPFFSGLPRSPFLPTTLVIVGHEFRLRRSANSVLRSRGVQPDQTVVRNPASRHSPDKECAKTFGRCPSGSGSHKPVARSQNVVQGGPAFPSSAGKTIVRSAPWQ